jgi:uncharacterized repeat protein (TIGR03803 family)
MRTLSHTFLLCLFALVKFNTLNAEDRALWTTMLGGGTNGLGVIYKVNNDGTDGAIAVAFNGANGANPSGNLVQAPDSKIYGTTTAGGNYNHGVLFSYDPASNSYRVVHHFDSVSGSSPRDLLMASDGKIYGTTEAGGTYNSATAEKGAGIMYSYDPATGTFTKLFDFRGIYGEAPQGLMQGSDNKLYGMTRQGGWNNTGVLFSYEPGATTITRLHDFDDATGTLPTNCKLMQAANHKLYGLTTWGGSNNMGTIFSYDIASAVFAKLYDFNGINGSYPSCTLLQANNGVLYGVTLYGGANGDGVIFKYNINTTTYGDLYDFNGAQGAVPFGSLIQGSDNLLYGMTTQGGTNGTGVIYNYDINTDNYNVIRDCDPSTGGSKPMSTLLELSGTATGIHEIADASIHIYPNPASQELVLETGVFTPEQISVYNVSGQQISKAKFATRLDISSLAAGTYLLELRKEDNVYRTRFVKM